MVGFRPLANRNGFVPHPVQGEQIPPSQKNKPQEAAGNLAARSGAGETDPETVVLACSSFTPGTRLDD